MQHEYNYGSMEQYGELVNAVALVQISGADTMPENEGGTALFEGFTHVAVFLSEEAEGDGWVVCYHRVADDGSSPDKLPLERMDFPASEGFRYPDAYDRFVRYQIDAIKGYLTAR